MYKRAIMLQKILLIFFFVGWCNAIESNIIEIMQRLQHASDLIQKGFFLNKFDLVQEGIKKHKEDFYTLQKFNIEVFLDSKNTNYAPIISSFISNIIEQRVMLEKFLKNNDKIRAYEAYQGMNLNCTKCHGLLRDW